MQTSKRTLLLRGIGLFFFIFIIFFGYNRFGRYIHGPQIIEISLGEYQQIDTLSLEITGTVQNVESLVIQGKNITFDDANTFNEIIVLSPGYTIIELDLTDPFGTQRTYSYAIETTATNPPYQKTRQEAQRESEQEESITEDIIN